jgi:phosphatidylglycerol lysyltransferase
MGLKIIKKVAILIVPVLFIAALVVLFHELRAYHLREIVEDFHNIGSHKIYFAILLTASGYLLMTGYDFLALQYINHPLPYTKIGFASFIGYAFSNNMGMSYLSGGSVRYRFYTLWGLSVIDVTKIIAFCVATLWLGFFTIAGTVFVIEPQILPPQVSFPFHSIRLFGIFLLTLVALSAVLSLTVKKPLMIKNWEFSMPSLTILFKPILLASVDWAIAGGVLYVLLPETPSFTYFKFLSIFLIAQLAGNSSQVPGGLGIFETVFILLLPSELSLTQAAGPLLLFRFIYYVAPLIVATFLLGIQEVLQRWDTIRSFHQAYSGWINTVIPVIFSITTFISGVILIFSGTLPAVTWRSAWLMNFLPLPVMELSHFMGSIIGVMLLLLAGGIMRRIDSAYVFTSVLLGAGIIFSLLRGFDYEEAIILSVMLAAFLPCHGYFHRKGSLIADKFSPGWLAAVFLVLLCSVWLGFFSFKHVNYSKDLWWTFTLHGDAPRFIRAMAGTIGLVLILTTWRFLSPSTPKRPGTYIEEHDRVLPVVRGSNATYANLSLLGDKSFLFNQKDDAFIMYAREGRSWIAMGDPVGPKDEWPELIWRFREMCDRQNGWTVFYEVSPENLYLYLDIGLTALKLGEEGRVALKDFSLEGGSKKDLRYAVNRLEKDSYEFQLIPQEDVYSRLEEFKVISDAWLSNKNTREKRFSLGFFNEEYLKCFPAGVVVKEGTILAFTNIFMGADKKELSVDLMRHQTNAPNGIMDYLFTKLMLWGKEEGFENFNLGMAPLSGFYSHEFAPLWNKIGALIFRHGEHFYNLQGLRQYKEKFNPVWEPKYMVSPGGLFIPRILANVASLISGGLKGLVVK